MLIFLAAPVAVLIFTGLVVRRFKFGELKIIALATEGEFGHFVELMEALRAEQDSSGAADVILILSSRTHVGLTALYSEELSSRVVWLGGAKTLLVQALVLQPRYLVAFERRTKRHSKYQMSAKTILPSRALQAMTLRIRENTKCRNSRFVVMAVYTREYEMDKNPEYAEKTIALESIGEDLAGSVDFLLGSGFDVLMLGSEDSGNSHVPRNIPRLKEFGVLGGREEVSLASTCTFFWTDGAVGAWWLSVPFGRPVLFTNQYHLPQTRGTMPRTHLVLPIRYQTELGNDLTLREILASKGKLFKEVQHGRLRRERNSEEEIRLACREMLARVDGTWREDSFGAELQHRAMCIYEKFPQFEPSQIPSTFLTCYPQLLD